MMCRYTNHVMADIGRHIGDGQFPIQPYQLHKNRPCTYCDYNTVCRFDSSRNKYNYLSGLSEDDALERMKEVLNEGNNSNDSNNSNDRNKSNVPNKSNVANSNNKGGEDRGC